MRLPRRIMRRLGMYRANRPGATRWMQQEPPPPRCPPGWSVGPPDFVGVGAQKAGTTWWFHLIAAHPDVYHDPDQRLELHFWDRYSHSWPTADDIGRYHRLFPRPPGAKTGEKTPDYMVDYWVPRMLVEAAPEARILVLLRDPIERYRSATAHGTAKGWIRDRMTERVIFEYGLYAGQLARVFAAFGRDQVLVLQYERCTRDAPAQLARTYEFLHLPAHLPAGEEFERRRNAAAQPKATLDPKRLETLIAAYAPDVRLLCDLVPDLDLSLWPNFAQLD